MSFEDFMPNKKQAKKFWSDVEDGALSCFLDEIQSGLHDLWVDMLQEKGEGLIQRLWEVQLEQGFNTFAGGPFFYPTGTKFFYHTDATTIVVVEQQPCVRTIKYCDEDYDRTYGDRYTIALPYVVFCFMYRHTQEDCWLQNTGCYFANESLTDMDSKVAIAALPNLHDNGAICFGVDSGRNGFKPEASFKLSSKALIKHIERCVTFFWSSMFNTDLNANYNLNRVKTRNLNFDKWQKKSEENPAFVLNVKWENPMTLSKALTVLPGYDARYEDDGQTAPRHYFEASPQLDDVYGDMMENSRKEVEKYMKQLEETPAFEGLRAVFNASIEMYIQRATKRFVGKLNSKVSDLPSYRRGEVQSCIEDSLKAAMMATTTSRSRR